MLSRQAETLKLEHNNRQAQLVDDKHLGSSSLGASKQITTGMITSSTDYVDLYSLLPSVTSTVSDEAKEALTIKTCLIGGKCPLESLKGVSWDLFCLFSLSMIYQHQSAITLLSHSSLMTLNVTRL